MMDSADVLILLGIVALFFGAYYVVGIGGLILVAGLVMTGTGLLMIWRQK